MNRDDFDVARAALLARAATPRDRRLAAGRRPAISPRPTGCRPR